MKEDYAAFVQGLPKWPSWATEWDHEGGTFSFYSSPTSVYVTDTATDQTRVVTVRTAMHHSPDGSSEGPWVVVEGLPAESVVSLLPSDALALARALEVAK